MSSAFLDYYRCPADRARFSAATRPDPAPGFFRFETGTTGGETGTVCFGRSEGGGARPDVESPLVTLHAERPAGGGWRLPFDPDEIADNFRRELWAARASGWAGSEPAGPGGPGLVRRAYYGIRPWLPVGIRRHAQRFWMRNWRAGAFPRWPVDTSLDDLMGSLMALAVQDGGGPVPFVWFWPLGQEACLILTHDAETAEGRDFCEELIGLDEAHGLKGSIEVIPERRYEVPDSFLSMIRARGFEVNVHGLYHDGRLFDDRDEFLRRVERINHYAMRWGARGFRSPVGYRKLDWFDRLTSFDYDMSLPTVGRLEAQRGGCCTVMPWFLGHLVELPLTTTQDYTLINILNSRSIDLWRQQIGEIVARNGLLSFVLHPDYVRAGAGRLLFEAVLDELQDLCRRSRIWNPLPREAAAWWRTRARLTVVSRNGEWVVEGEGADQACVGWAELVDGRLACRAG